MESDWIVAEPGELYRNENNFPFSKETYEIIGLSMEIHRILGKGFSEIVYKGCFGI